MHNFSTKNIHRSNRANFVMADSSAFSLCCLSTFFECEMKVSFINIDSRLKKMEDYTDITNYQTYKYMNTNQD